jgi:hypothetical protein
MMKKSNRDALIAVVCMAFALFATAIRMIESTPERANRPLVAERIISN